MLGREAAAFKVAKKLSKWRSSERLTCLAWRVFTSISCQKWGVVWLATGVSDYIWIELNGGKYRFHSDKTSERVCVSPASKEQICLLYTKVITNKDFKRKLTISGGQKQTKSCLNLELIARKERSSGEGSPEISSGEGSLWQTFCAKIVQTKMKP